MSSRLSKYQKFRRVDDMSARKVDERVSRERRALKERIQGKIRDVNRQISSMNARKEKLVTQLVSIEEQIDRMERDINEAESYLDDLTRRLQSYLNSSINKRRNS